MSSLLFLGTGGGDFPALDDPTNESGHLPRVRQLGGKCLRHAASAALLPDILVDLYSDRQLQRFGIGSSIRHLLITHGHFDHFQPLAICEFASCQPQPLEVYGNEMVGQALEFAATHRWDGESGRFSARQTGADIRFHLVEPGETRNVGAAVVTPVLSNHCIDKARMIAEQRALNYVFECEGKTVFYGLDSSYALPRSLDLLRRFTFDVAVFDATFGRRDIDPAGSGHHNFRMLRETVAEFRDLGMVTDDTIIVASHLSLVHVEPHDDIVDELALEGIALAYDGMTVDL